jgi:hypothetical protein
MKKILVVDIEKHFPPAANMFPGCDYFSPNLQPHEMKCLQPIPSAMDTKIRYGFLPKSSWEELEETYDAVVFIWPVHSFNDPGYTPNIQERRDYFKEIYDRLSKKKIQHYIYIDDSDRAIVKRGLDWLDQEGLRCDAVFKREYREGWKSDYDERVHPFPFVMFGKPNAAWVLYEEKNYHDGERLNQCFWAGVPRFNMDPSTPDEHVDRNMILNSIGHSISFFYNLTPEVFLDTFTKYKFFLNLNGNGHLCKRFFEGLSRGSLMMMQETDLVFPFENGDYFSKQTVFKDGYEFLWKFEDLKNNDKIYKSCLINQKYLVNKYYNYEWIRDYIFKAIDKK